MPPSLFDLHCSPLSLCLKAVTWAEKKRQPSADPANKRNAAILWGAFFDVVNHSVISRTAKKKQNLKLSWVTLLKIWLDRSSTLPVIKLVETNDDGDGDDAIEDIDLNEDAYMLAGWRSGAQDCRSSCSPQEVWRNSKDVDRRRRYIVAAAE
jgi:hypothetical protein